MAIMELRIDGESEPVLRELTPEEIADLPAAPRREIPKSLVWARIVDLGKAADAKTALDADPVAWGRWFSPDWPNVFADDEGLLDFLSGPLALDEIQVSAVTA